MRDNLGDAGAKTKLLSHPIRRAIIFTKTCIMLCRCTVLVSVNKLSFCASLFPAVQQ